MYVNLKQETQRELEYYNKSFDDIKWIGYIYPHDNSLNRYIDKEDWDEVLDVEYDNGYGIVHIDENLIICGEDWWFERHEYDGSEWWEYKSVPIKPTICIKKSED